MRKAFAVATLVVAALALAASGVTAGVNPHYRAPEGERFFVYLPWVQHTGEVRVSILWPGGLTLRLDPTDVTVRPGTVVAWTNKAPERVQFVLGQPLALMQPEETFRLVFTTPGTFSYEVVAAPGSLLAKHGFGTVTVAE